MTDSCARAAMLAWMRPRDPAFPDPQIADCERLAEFDVFSNNQLEAITGLSRSVVARITNKVDHRGGRLEPATLPMIAALEEQWGEGVRNRHLARQVVLMGTSRRMIARLTGIPATTVERMTP